MAKTKYVYFFGDGAADGDASMRAELGGKGANLAEMATIGLPVPPGFTISTDVCQLFYKLGRKYPADLNAEVDKYLAKLEKSYGKKLGDAKDPLLVSVRSGAAISMPGMMDTILNLGLNDESVLGLASKTQNPRFAWDAYRRFIQMFGDVAMGVDHDKFEEILENAKAKAGVKLDKDLSAEQLKEVVAQYKALYKREKGEDFPQDPKKQMWGAIGAVFGSWMNPRAIKYRELNGIKEGALKGTAVTVMAMVFGNKGETSGTGVCFSRDPSTGVNEFMGEYLMNAQGEDVVAGIRTPQKLSQLEETNKPIYDQLCKIRAKLEKHYRDMQDMEFTVEEGKLFMLQCRNGKRTAAAAVKMAVDMVAEKLITKEQALLRVEPVQLNQLLLPTLDPAAVKKAVAIASGLNASPGAGCGQIVFTADEAVKMNDAGKKVLLVRKETSPDDIAGMAVAKGILTSTGGRTSHAAVVARGMGTPCVCGCEAVKFPGGDKVIIGSKTFSKGDFITIDGSTGHVYEGQLAVKDAEVSGDFATFLGWADEIREKSVRKTASGKTVRGFEVRANGDTPKNAQDAFRFGAAGIGLCRTEHMFFDEPKLTSFQKMIISENQEARRQNLKAILPLQEKDFYEIIKTMEGRPVTIRLLDPPLNEFIQAESDAQKDALARKLGVDKAVLAEKVAALNEHNPMLGHRGCRLAITYPEIYEMQVEAIARATAKLDKEGVKHSVQIMIPNVISYKEVAQIREQAEAVIAKVNETQGTKLSFEIGTMVEFPRAALSADKLAQYADFFSFGTNDLSQTTFGFSRDDYSKFIDAYLKVNDVEKGPILDEDPFNVLDADGPGALMEIAEAKGRSVKSDLHLGICGEHGGDPESIALCYKLGLNYVSCSPFRVPLARLAGAQAIIKAALAAKAAKAPAKKKAPAKTAAAEKKAPAKKASAAKKTASSAKKAPAKKAPAKKAVAEKKTPGRKPAAAKKTASSAKKAPAKRTSKK